MTTLVWTNCQVVVNSVDLSNHVRSVAFTYEAEQQDETPMGPGGVGQPGGTRTNKPGLLSWSFEIEFYQDFAAGETDATLFPLVGAAAFTLAVRPVNAAIGATNPEFTGPATLAAYPPITGAVGDMAISTGTFNSAGTLDRDITP